MTERLYFTDSYQCTFRATVVAVGMKGDKTEDDKAKGGRITIQLDRTCFYPTSGGQPFDTGTLAGREVIDVMADADGTIHHLLAAASADPVDVNQVGTNQVEESALATLVGSGW